MSCREILQLGDPLLRTRCEAVDPDDPGLSQLIADLRDTVTHSWETTGYGRAIAAPQIGVLQRVIYMRAPKPLVLINPEIISRSDATKVVWDACLSFLCIFMQVRRYEEITVAYHIVGGELCEQRFGSESDLSELLQHEIDHLDGILALDRVEDVGTICTREEFERRFKQQSSYGGG